jgi:hypothetical protein
MLRSIVATLNQATTQDVTWKAALRFTKQLEFID